MSFLTQFQGEVAALTAAIIWAIASIVYANVGRQLPPLVLNLVKGLIALVLLVLTLAFQGKLFPTIAPSSLGLLLTSGAIGIGLGDTAYFAALNRIGPRRTLLLEALAPSIAALIALTFLAERLSLNGWVGILLTIAGVTWVVVERTPDLLSRPEHPFQGLILGLLAALGQATGATLSRAALVGTDIDPLWSTLVRLVAGVLVLLVWLLAQRQSWRSLKPLTSHRLLLLVAGTAFASTYLAIWLQQISLKYAPTGIAQALSSTSPLFILPIALWRGERLSVRAIMGVWTALAGIWLLFQGNS